MDMRPLVVYPRPINSRAWAPTRQSVLLSLRSLLTFLWPWHDLHIAGQARLIVPVIAQKLMSPESPDNCTCVSVMFETQASRVMLVEPDNLGRWFNNLYLSTVCSQLSQRDEFLSNLSSVPCVQIQRPFKMKSEGKLKGKHLSYQWSLTVSDISYESG